MDSLCLLESILNARELYENNYEVEIAKTVSASSLSSNL